MRIYLSAHQKLIKKLFPLSSFFSFLFVMTFICNECQKCVLQVVSKKSFDDSIATRCVGTTAARWTSIVGPRALKERENEGAASHGAPGRAGVSLDARRSQSHRICREARCVHIHTYIQGGPVDFTIRNNSRI